jgi:hypothetical protein
MITVAELIERLQEFPENMPVKIFATYDFGFGSVGGDIIFIEKDKHDYAVVLSNDEG